jgi:hypothetical protein
MLSSSASSSEQLNVDTLAQPLSGDGQKVVTLEATRTLAVPELSWTLEGCSKGS